MGVPVRHECGHILALLESGWSAVAGQLLGKLDDRDSSMRPDRITSIARISGENAVGKGPQPLSLGLIVYCRRSHRDSTEEVVRMSSEVVIPSWVSRAPGVRCSDGDTVSIMKVDDRFASPSTAFRTLRLEHGGGENERRRQAAMGGS